MSWGLRAQIDELRTENADLKRRLQHALEVHQNRLDEWNKCEAEYKILVASVKLRTAPDTVKTHDTDLKCCPAKPGEGCPVACPKCGE